MGADIILRAQGENPEPAMPRRPIVTLLTDFGLADPYVAVMKGVIMWDRQRFL